MTIRSTLHPKNARAGRPGFIKTFLSRLLFKKLSIFPVPGISTLLAMGYDPSQKGIVISPTPRHANVMLVLGPLPNNLAKNAAVAFAQMPRPRILVFAGVENVPDLPPPDLVIEKADLSNLAKLSQELRAKELWSENPISFEPETIKEALAEQSENGGREHSHHTCGHKHGEHHSEEEEGQSHSMHHAHTNKVGKEKSPSGPESKKKNQENKENQDKKDHSQENDGSSAKEKHHKNGVKEESDTGENEEKKGDMKMDHNGGMSGGMGFMSMVAMTKDMPRSKDGLPMEMTEAHFGPFHPGLPGGLRIKATLDGDTVMNASCEQGLLARHLLHDLPKSPDKLAAHIAQLNPLLPKTYHILTINALLNALKAEEIERNDSEIYWLEHERILNHLNWLSIFGSTLGDRVIQHEAMGLFHVFQSQKNGSTQLKGLGQKIKKRPYLKSKLKHAGEIPPHALHHISGPVAKAAGSKADVRLSDAGYLKKGFAPVVVEENNAWGQLLVRLEEIEQSLLLISGISPESLESKRLRIEEIIQKEWEFEREYKGHATLEAPAGKLSMMVQIKRGKVEKVSIKAPSIPLAATIPDMCKGLELSDALVSIAALDLSPWEIDR